MAGRGAVDHCIERGCTPIESHQNCNPAHLMTNFRSLKRTDSETIAQFERCCRCSRPQPLANKDSYITSPLASCNPVKTSSTFFSLRGLLLFCTTSSILITQTHHHFMSQPTMASKPESLPELFESVKAKFPAKLGTNCWFLVVAVSRYTPPSQESPPQYSRLTHSSDLRTHVVLGQFPAGTTLRLSDKATRVCFPASSKPP